MPLSASPGGALMRELFRLIGRREFLKSCAKGLLSGICLVLFGDTRVFGQKTQEYDPTQHKYAMGIDVHKCIGCGRCVDSCKSENNVSRRPDNFRTWVERYIIHAEEETVVESPNGGIDGFPALKGDVGILKTFFVPKLCNQCSNPPLGLST